MTRPVYSELLGELLPASTGVNLLGNPPLGTLWIVKDVSVMLDEVFPHEWPGWYVEDNAGISFFSRLSHWCIGGVTYEWHGSQVIAAGTYLYFRNLGGAWQVRATGYQLTLP